MRASSATSRASTTPKKMRRAQAAPGFRARILPVRHAAAHPVAEVAFALHADVAHPALLAADRVERDDLAERRGQIHHAVDDQRRGFERGGIAGLDAGFAGLVFPGERELAHVVAVDLRERRMPVAARRAAVVRPVAGGGLGGVGRDHRQGRQEPEQKFFHLDPRQVRRAQSCRMRTGYRSWYAHGSSVRRIGGPIQRATVAMRRCRSPSPPHCQMEA